MDEKTLNRLQDLLDIQKSDGNWNYDNYMLGIYNGMEIMMAVIEKRDPIFRTCSDEDFLYHTTKSEIPKSHNIEK